VPASIQAHLPISSADPTRTRINWFDRNTLSRLSIRHVGMLHGPIYIRRMKESQHPPHEILARIDAMAAI
jgi:hypothetical protein